MSSLNNLRAWTRRVNPLALLIVTIALAVLGTLAFGVLILNLPERDIQPLIVFMSITGIVTTVTSYLLYRFGLLHLFQSLRWALMAIIVFTVALVLLNVWVVARFTFVDVHYVQLTTTLLLFAGLTAISFGFFVSRAMTDRLSALSEATARLAGGDLKTRCAVGGHDEISRLGQAFNEMAASLQAADDEKRALEEARRNLIAWVSHDLRTPLATMRLMIESMADGVVHDEATVNRYFTTTLSEINHLSRLIDDLFELTQLDVGHLQLDKQPASLRDLLSDTIGTLAEKAAKRDIALTGEIGAGIDVVPMAPDKIQRVLYNLVTNAITYTPRGQRITLDARRQADCIQIDITNTGIVIPDDELPHLFTSFYRGEKSRAASDEGERGTGLGLAIARGFVEAHGGTIWARSGGDPARTTFSFTLPAV